MTITHPGARLRELLRMDTPDALIAPGCYDGISAKLVEQAGYQAQSASSARVSAIPT